MNDVVIRRCTLRVVRHGGWSWGSERRSLLEHATAALPRLIAERLAELLGEVEGEILQPIRLRFVLRAGQLASGEGLARVVASGMRAELLPLPSRSVTQMSATSRAAIERDVPDERPRSSASGYRTPEDAGFPGPSGMLLRWRDQGVLWQRLQGFSLRALELWLKALLAELQAVPRELASAPTLRSECAGIYRTLPLAADDPSGVHRARLAIAVELAARHVGAVTGGAVLRMLDDVVPVTAASAPAVSRDAPSEPHVDRAAQPLALSGAPHASGNGTSAVRRAPARLAERDVKLCSVLPYLVLGILHRLGWLHVASATLRALDLPDHGSVFATALAYKLLPCPERGWHRSAAVLRTAAAFAGVRAPASPDELASWSRVAADALCPLDDFVVGELARGHDSSLPLLVMRVDSCYDRSWLLLDADGCFPVAWEQDESALRRIIRRFGPCVILVSAEAATPALMRGLTADRRSYVTAATPGRHDDWQRVRGTPCWAGGSQALARRIVEAAGLLPELVAQALAVTRALLHLRPTAPPRQGAELEHTAALAAATGLGALAWTLWGKRETVHPLLALRRFENLDGIARIRDAAIEIHPAFGRRYLDLQKHGLLADIPAPPWLDARRIVFVGP